VSSMKQSEIEEVSTSFLHGFYDEMYDNVGGVRPHYKKVHKKFSHLPPKELLQLHAAMNNRMLEEGITFNLYQENHDEPLERTIPFDPIPRIIPHSEWVMLEKGLKQRAKALNAFVSDLYKDQHIIHDGIIPRRSIVNNRYFRPEMMHLSVPNDIYINASGIDLIRDELGHYFVLEDNLRSPSGFSYLFKSRSIMTETFPELIFSHSVNEVQRSLNQFLTSLRSIAPLGKKNPVIALLTPGSFNAAYYEHTFLAQQMGIELVEGRDLVCQDHKIYIRGIKGMKQVDVIYRRIDDDYLDPLSFQSNSTLGVAGLMNAYRAGNVAIANAPGTGIADDKAIYTYVPEMINYYLNEQPLLDNVPTYCLGRPDELDYVFTRINQMVIKETSLSGGYGMLVGPASTASEIRAFTAKILRNPHNYIAQPTIKLSTAPICTNGAFAHRHIDLRAFVLMGENQIDVIPGGLTRVAMTEGSLVVNSSQGGGCKDTWVLSK